MESVTYMKHLAALSVMAICVFPARGLDDLRITVQGTNAIMSWPSAGYEAFIVRYRPDLQPGSTWVTLTNNYPATPGTNRTSFTHLGGVIPPVPCGGEGGGGSSGPPAPGEGLVLRVPGLDGRVDATMEPTAYVEGATTPRRRTAIRTEERYIPLPPLPRPLWDTLSPEERARQEAMAEEAEALVMASDSRQSPLSDEPSCGVSMGFYQVFLVPDTWFGYNQYQFTDSPEFIPVYLGVDAVMVSKMELLIDGQPFAYVEFALEEYNFGTPQAPDWEWTYGLWVDHDRMTNGTHQFAVRTTLELDSGLTHATPYLVMTAPTFTSVVSNPISFSVWNDTIVGTNQLFEVRTTTYPANWQIDIYDANAQFVRTQTGSTSNGNISWTWDLRDSSGVLRNAPEADPYFDPYVTVAAVGGGSPRTKPAPMSALDYPSLGEWMFAYQDKDKPHPEARTAILQALASMRGGPSYFNIPNNYILLQYGKDVHTNAATAQIIRNNSWLGLRSFLFRRENRNFYYLGHGAANSIGGDWDRVGTNNVPVGSERSQSTNPVSVAYMQTSWVRTNLVFNRYSGPTPYRFAFVDGCSTANGDWPDAFGVGRTTNNLAYYQNPNRKPKTRPAAYVGWAEATYYSDPLGSKYGNEWGDYQQFANFRSQWIFNWSQNAQTTQLLAALQQARVDSGWISLTTFSRAIRVFGYQSLHFNEYNHRGDWQ